MKHTLSSKGFSLIELVVVLAILGALVAIIGLPFATFRKQQALQNTTNGVVALLQDARTKTLAAVNNTSYSVRIESDRAIMFDGVTYDQNDISNEVFLFETPVTAGSVTLYGGGSTISFDRLKGTTTQYGTISVSVPNQTRIVTVSATGAITRN